MAQGDEAGLARGAASARSSKKANGQDSHAESNKLHIGEGVVIRGEVVVPDTVVVDGTLEGDIKTHRLIVGQSGVVKGKVSVTGNADVFGRTIDHLEVKNLLVVRASGSIEGTVSYGELLIERGGAVAGGISSSDYRPTSENGGQPVVSMPGRRAPRASSPKEALAMRDRVFPPVSYVTPSQVIARNTKASRSKRKGATRD